DRARANEFHLRLRAREHDGIGGGRLERAAETIANAALDGERERTFRRAIGIDAKHVAVDARARIAFAQAHESLEILRAIERIREVHADIALAVLFPRRDLRDDEAIERRHAQLGLSFVRGTDGRAVPAHAQDLLFLSARETAQHELVALTVRCMRPIDRKRAAAICRGKELLDLDRKSTRLNSSHVKISYAVFCLKKKK